MDRTNAFAAILTICTVGHHATAQPQYMEIVSTQSTLQASGTSGAGQILVPAFDSGDGRRILLGVGVQSSVLTDSRVRGTVSHPSFSGGPQAESRGQLRVSGQVRMTAPATQQAQLNVDRGGTVFSTGTFGSPPRPGAINLFASVANFPMQTPTSLSSYLDTTTWPKTLNWSLSTTFVQQEGPNLWQFTNRSTVISARVTTTYTYSIDPTTVDVDMNDDGAENVFDVIAFLGRFSTDDPTADVTLDGVLTPDDVVEFLRASDQ